MNSLADSSKLKLVAFVIGEKLDNYISLIRAVQVICWPLEVYFKIRR